MDRGLSCLRPETSNQSSTVNWSNESRQQGIRKARANFDYEIKSRYLKEAVWEFDAISTW